MLKFFKKKGFKVAGVEMVKDLYEIMKKDKELKEVKIMQGDITDKKGEGEFDYVLACDVIEHIDNDIGALNNLITYLKPDGNLILTVPAHSYLFGKRDIRLGHYRRYDKSELIDKINRTNGRIDSITYWNFIGFFVYFIYEKILRQPVDDNFRYKKNIFSRFVSFFLSYSLRIEELLGAAPIGLTLVVCIKRAK